MKENGIEERPIIAYLIWKGSYNVCFLMPLSTFIIAYLIWKGSYNMKENGIEERPIIAYLIWKGSYNAADCHCRI